MSGSTSEWSLTVDFDTHIVEIEDRQGVGSEEKPWLVKFLQVDSSLIEFM